MLDFNVLRFRSGPFKKHSAEIMEELKGIGISAYVISIADLGKSEEPFEANLGLFKECCGLKKVYLLATIDPTYPKCPIAVRELLSLGFCGVRLTPSRHEYKLDSHKLSQVISWLDYEGIINISIRMTWRDAPQVDFDSITSIAKDYGDVHLIISGVNYTESPWLVKDMREVTNVLVEISLYQPLNGIKFLVDVLGEDRVLFGTGYPAQYPHCTIFKVLYSDINDEAKEAILYRNGLRMLKRYCRRAV